MGWKFLVCQNMAEFKNFFYATKLLHPYIVVDSCSIISTQIIATSYDLTLNGGSVREIPLFHGNLGW